MRVSVFIATSLDGYIARTDGSTDWLDELNQRVPPDENFGYQVFFDRIDALVVGRATFDSVRRFDTWPWGDKRVVVCTRRPLPDDVPRSVTGSDASPDVLLDRLRAEGVDHVYLDGGVTIRRFLALDLVDDFTITVLPIVLGEGRPLFGGEEVPLELLGSTTWPFGFLQLRYKVARLFVER